MKYYSYFNQNKYLVRVNNTNDCIEFCNVESNNPRWFESPNLEHAFVVDSIESRSVSFVEKLSPKKAAEVLKKLESKEELTK